jgi:lysophospholipase L1-like esterase
VVFYGDSITDGWRLNEYFPGKDFVNRGISGQITGEMLGRMQADVIDNKPAAMLILAGTNDIARGVAVETIQNNLTMIADLASHHGIKVIMASILPTSDHHKDKNPRFEMTKGRPLAVIRGLNTFIADLCRKKGFLYLNYYDAMVDSTGQLKAELANDGLHPNAEGYKVMAPLALAAIDQALASRIPQQTGKKKRP